MSDMKDERLTVRFPLELRRRLKAAALRSGTKESDVVRGAVQQHLDAAAILTRTTAYDKVKKAGLIGLVRGSNRDLSTNRLHFEGFGKSRSGKSRGYGPYRSYSGRDR
jgi:predicted DNA-binding protein